MLGDELDERYAPELRGKQQVMTLGIRPSQLYLQVFPHRVCRKRSSHSPRQESDESFYQVEISEATEVTEVAANHGVRVLWHSFKKVRAFSNIYSKESQGPLEDHVRPSSWRRSY